jgi:hypothetical protein
MKAKSFLILIFSTLFVFACGKKDNKTNGTTPPSVSAQTATVATFKYYKGGFFPPPNQPSWSNDMTITFTNAGFYIEGRHADPLCFRSGSFSQAQTTELFNLVSALLLSTKTPGGPITADAGVEYVQITLSNGEVRKYHLMNLEVPVGELYALNPTDLRNYLRALEASLDTACR